MKRSNQRIAIAALLSSVSAFAANSKPVNSYCAQAHVTAFHVRLLSGVDDDYCSLGSAEVPAEIRGLLTRLESLHEKTASFMGISVDALLPQGIEVILVGDKMASLGSFSSDGTIQLGVFPNWNGDPIDESAYVHELGHVLVFARTPLTPFMQKAGLLKIYREGFPDFLALSVTGQAIEATGFPACFASSTRDFGPDSTFTADHEYFSVNHSIRMWEGCCSELRKSGGLTERAHAACTQIDLQAKQLAPDKTPIPFTPKYCIDLSPYSSSPFTCSLHQLSTPINSFLLELGVKLDLPVPKLYLQALTESGARPEAFVHFSCGTAKIQPMTVDEPSPEVPLKVLREKLTSAQQRIFDQLWNAHGLDQGMLLGRMEIQNDALLQARQRSQFVEFCAPAAVNVTLAVSLP